MEKKWLEKPENLLAAVFASMQDGMVILDENLNIVRVNPTMEARFAQNLPLIGKKCYEAFRNSGQPCEDCASIQALRTGQPASGVVPKRGANGKIEAWMELYSFPLKDPVTGEVMGVVEHTRDITSRLQAEEELRQAKEELEQRIEERTAALRTANATLQKEIEERNRVAEALRMAEAHFRTLVEHSLVGIYIMEEGKISYANPKLAEIFGLTQAEILHKSPLEIVVPEDRPLVAENMRKRLSGEIGSLRYTFRGIKEGGEPINVEVHSSRIEIQGKPAIIGTLRDITRLTRVLEALARRDAILEAVSFAALGFMMSADWRQNLEEVLHRLGQVTGVSRVEVFENFLDDAAGLRARRFCEWASARQSPETADLSGENFSWGPVGHRNWAATLSQGEPVWGCVQKNGRQMSVIDVPIFVGGEWWGIIGFEDDGFKREWSREEIEALKAASGIIGGALHRDRTQQALKRQENLLRTIFHTIPDLIVLKDRDLVYRAVNPAFCRFLQKREEEILGKKDQDLFPGKEAEVYRCDDLTAMESGHPLMRDEQVTGTTGCQWLQVLKTPVLDEKGVVTGILCSCRDISMRKKAEETLRGHRARLRKIIDDNAG